MRRSHLEWLQTSSRLRRSYVFEHVGWPCLNEVEEGAKDTSDGSMTYTKKKKKKKYTCTVLEMAGHARPSGRLSSQVWSSSASREAEQVFSLCRFK